MPRGKLIQYHGWSDAAIAPRDSINFYEKVESFMKRHPDPRWTGASDIEAFYRLFMVPGLQHCAGGTGATIFGNAGTPVGAANDPDHDIVLALDRWVTQGVAPDKIIPSGVSGADTNTDSGAVRLTRPLRPYPATARHKGQGDPNVAENFECLRESSQ